MKDERECFEPASWSMPARTSVESVIEVFSFILLIYYHSLNPQGEVPRYSLLGKSGFDDSALTLLSMEVGPALLPDHSYDYFV